MRVKAAGSEQGHLVHLRVRDEARSMIDRAAQMRGKSRSEFMVEASLAAAEDTVLDQTFVTVDAETYAQFLKILDEPPETAGFARLMAAPTPWNN